MLRSRVIRPGIAMNEELAALGPYAEILFTRLWMLADRDGRLEDRPRRIKVEAMPYYDVDVENLLENLWKSGFIVRYKTRDKRALIQICEFRKHQPIHPHEPKGGFPPPTPQNGNGASHRKRPRSPSDKNISNVMTCNGDAVTPPDNGDTCKLVSYSYSFLRGGGDSGEEYTHLENSPPPPPETQKPTQAPPPVAARKLPARETQQGGKHPKAHDAADVELLRDSLNGLAGEVGMPPPDTALIERTLDAGNGASGAEIHAALVALFKRGKFQAMRSWGFVPLVIGDAFQCSRLRTG